MVFYRKYRPQTIDELDSSQVRETIFSLLSQDPPHALLFTGPKGLGKTSTARIIAKAVNCTTRAINNEPGTKQKEQKVKKVLSSESKVQSGEASEPCNHCEQCLSITAGTNMDVIEIDAASNRGIDEIRDLREKIWLAPLSARKKIYIIDEVHMLTTEAFNALLKTLEEPPAHAMFILCTTEPQKVPATILSRSFHIQFRPATAEELVRSFTRIVKGEKIDITPDALNYIAKLSGRGFRDGVKILEEMTLSAQGAQITKEFIEKTYRTVNSSVYLSDFLQSLEKKNAKKGLELIKTLLDQGTDLRFFISSTLEVLHDILLTKVGVLQDKNNLDYKFSIEEIKQLTELLSKAAADMKYAVLPQLPLELAVIEFDSQSLPPAKKEDIPSKADEKADTRGEVTVEKLRKQTGAMNKLKALYGDTVGKEAKDKVVQKTDIRPSVELLHVPAEGDLTDEWLSAFWKSIISEIKQYNHTIAGVLRSCVLKSYDRKLLVIETAFNFHKERLDDKKAREALYNVCKSLTGNEVEIEVQLKK